MALTDGLCWCVRCLSFVGVLPSGLVVVLYSRNKEALASRALAAEDARRAALTKESTAVALAMGAASGGVEMQTMDNDALLAALHRPIVQGGDASFSDVGGGASRSVTPRAPSSSESPRWVLNSEPYPHRARAASVDGAFVLEAADDDPAAVSPMHAQLPMPPPVRSVSSGSNVSAASTPTSVESPRRSPRTPTASVSTAQVSSHASSALSSAQEANPFDTA